MKTTVHYGIYKSILINQVMIFGKQRKNVQFSANNIELEIVKNYHFLGITFTKKQTHDTNN